MANFYDQAQAIWDSLNTMLEKDPEGYKKFITEQLREGETVLKKEKASETGASSTSLKGKLSPFSDQKTKPKYSSGNDKTTKAGVTTSGAGRRVPIVELTKSNQPSSTHTNSLTDDAICGTSSLLAQMVINEPDVDEDEPEIAFHELKIPTDVRAPALINTKNKPLIEEL